MPDTLDDQKREVYGEAGLLRLHQGQEDRLLPQLERKKEALEIRVADLNEQLDEIRVAISDIHNGRITDYQIRRPKEKARDLPA